MIEKGNRPAIDEWLRMLAVAVAAPFLFLAPCASAADRPNIVLFVVDDMGETNNLAAKRPETVKELDALIDGFIQDTGKRLWSAPGGQGEQVPR